MELRQFENNKERLPNHRNMYVIGAYKQRLLDLLKLDKDFQLALLHRTIEPPKNESEEKYITKQLFKDHVYDHAFVPGTSNEERIFVCMEVTCPYADGTTFKDLYIQIYVFTPKMKVNWDDTSDEEFIDEKNGIYTDTSVQGMLEAEGYIGNKIDMVVDIIDRKLNGLKHLSLGKLTLAPRDGLRIFSYVDGYYGKQLTYTASDFNLLPPSALHDNYKDGKPDYDE